MHGLAAASAHSGFGKSRFQGRKPMSSRDNAANAATPDVQKWTLPTLARELAVILSASAAIITLLMLLKGLQTLI
jgi:hypothetical protein